MYAQPASSSLIHCPPTAGTWNDLLEDFVDDAATTVDARPLFLRPELAPSLRLWAPPPVAALEVALAPRSDSNVVVGLDGCVEGLFVATWRELPVGACVALEVHLPGGVSFHARGRVELVRTPQTGVPGVVVAFDPIAMQDLERLERFACMREPVLY